MKKIDKKYIPHLFYAFVLTALCIIYSVAGSYTLSCFLGFSALFLVEAVQWGILHDNTIKTVDELTNKWLNAQKSNIILLEKLKNESKTNQKTT